MSQQRAGPPASLLSAAKCTECRIGIAHALQRNGLTGREKRNHIRLFMLYKVTLYLFKAYFGRWTNCLARNDSSRPLGSIGVTLIWGRSLRNLISSPSLGKKDEEALRIVGQATG